MPETPPFDYEGFAKRMGAQAEAFSKRMREQADEAARQLQDEAGRLISSIYGVGEEAKPADQPPPAG